MTADAPHVVLDEASFDDAAFVFECRNDPDARANSFNTDPVPWDDHLTWYQGALASPDIRIFIARCGGEAVGVGRGNKTPTGWVLSWAVAKGARGRGVGRGLLKALMVALDGPLEAWARGDNLASLKMARACGMKETGMNKDGFIQFRLDR